VCQPYRGALTLRPGAQAFDWRGAQHEGLRIADVSVGTGKPVADGALLTARAPPEFFTPSHLLLGLRADVMGVPLPF